ncbi:hypothetical protein BJF85_10820 [Saccharomonospora sp. CUA-673]|uniref:hypothetical protein n=1 Tax=Saccharomonospora sp. CUA-673 TaxID=1904969 RepID=UPI00095A5FF2|nr:hypothetical protein [Saccharomonospora sp. CUA-673]OLT48951.1 hypothetical protein BJF85_10820 [Saccharomonospora sp. CUA-673]
MKKTIARGVVGATLAGALLVAGLGAGTAAAATESPDEVPVVDEPDTSDLNNIYTVAPLGVPVLGLIQSVADVPGKLLPSFEG